MRIVMLTNTYLPHVGGVARSVSSFQAELSRRGHDVWVIAPQFAGALDSTPDVLRTPAVQNFNGSDFSVTIPQPGLVAEFLDHVRPQILHSHHPFLLGDTALRAAWTRRLPVVFTHHTLYEQYTRYVPLDSEALQRAVVQMVTEYCNLCTHVIAPSESIAELLRRRAVTTPITVIPTGIDLEKFGGGDGPGFRRRHGIPQDALVVGHVGRLAGEKNLEYLAEAVGLFLAQRPDAVLAVVGSGDCEELLQERAVKTADPRRIRMLGTLTGPALYDAYAAMDVFVFSSQSETQGMVLAEAMAARNPVVALDGPGVRDVLHDASGRLLPAAAPPVEFAAALDEVTRDRSALRQFGESARQSIGNYSLAACTERLEELYQQLLAGTAERAEPDWSPWDAMLRRLEIEWNLLVEKTSALRAAVVETTATTAQLR